MHFMPYFEVLSIAPTYGQARNGSSGVNVKDTPKIVSIENCLVICFKLFIDDTSHHFLTFKNTNCGQQHLVSILRIYAVGAFIWK